MFKKSPSKPTMPASSKFKKSSAKERERKKMCLMGEPSSSNSSSSSSNEKIQVPFEIEKQYTGFGPSTIQIIAEQFVNEQVSDEICLALAEDITYKMREIIKAAAINMKQSKRSYLKVDDVNATFKKYNIERIYGPSMPNWMTFGDPNDLSTIPEQKIDILDVATSEATLTDPGDVGIDYKWLKDMSLFNQLLVNNSLNNYSEKIMNAATSNKDSLRILALKDVAKNVNIGPIIQHLCNFCFLILQKKVTYNHLATPTLNLLEAITFNPCTSYSVEEKQMTLLIYLLLENIMNATNDMMDEVIPICRTLGRLCTQWPRGPQIVIDKVNKYLIPDEPIRRLSAPVILALTYIGNYTLNVLLWPHIDAMFKCIRQMELTERLQLEAAILKAASIMYRQVEWDFKADMALHMEFGDSLVPLWRWNYESIENSQENLDKESLQANWINIKTKLLKTQKIHSQQQISHRTSQFITYFRKAKQPVMRRTISIVGYKSLPTRRKTINIDEDVYFPSANTLLENNVNIITGRRTLFALKKTFTINNKKCSRNIRDMLYMM